MKRLLIISLTILALISCKKKEFTPEGPTDVRIRNITNMTFTDVILRTSDEEEDIDTLGTINGNSESDYFRFTKAFPKAEISAKVDIGGTISTYSTGAVDFTYLQYLGPDKITYEVWIKDPDKKLLEIFNVIHEEPLVLK